jgi:glycosyltransferase involved in cell wall biosynthesis
MYFLPSEGRKHHFVHAGNIAAQLYPFLGQQGEIASFTYKVMKSVQPQVVVTIGSYEETSFVWHIKSLYPHLFKWVAIITSGDPINEHYVESLNYADCVVATNNDCYLSARKLLKIKVEIQRYGADCDIFRPLDIPLEDFCAVKCAKNSQMSNIPAFMMAIKQAGVYGTLHTNMHDSGDYDLMLLSRRYGLGEQLSLPQKYVSVREGITQKNMNELYNYHQVVVDCSTQSPTALSVLEAMATGCVPVGPAYGAVGDVLGLMAREFRFVIPHEMYVGTRGEEHAIVSIPGLSAALGELRDKWTSDKEWFKSAREDAIRVQKLFSRDLFLSSVNHTIQDVVSSQHTIVVDSFS